MKIAAAILSFNLNENDLKKLVESLLQCVTQNKFLLHEEDSRKSVLHFLKSAQKNGKEIVDKLFLRWYTILRDKNDYSLISVFKEITQESTKGVCSEDCTKLARLCGVRKEYRSTITQNNGTSVPQEEIEDFTKDPTSIAIWNVNGLKRRWNKKGNKSRDFMNLLNNVPMSNEEKFQLDFREVINEIDNPDVLIILESKMTLEKLLFLKGFEDWREKVGYKYVFSTWSRSTKSGPGYAGVIMFSKIRPQHVQFGIPNGGANIEGRVITAFFQNQIIVGTYAQCSGYTPEKVQLRKDFDKKLKEHITLLEKNKLDREIILAGDLNVTPRDVDVHPKAFDHMREEKKKHNAEFNPGCSPELNSV